MIEIKIKEVLVSGFASVEQTADTLVITSSPLNLIDDGVNITYHLTGNGEVVFNNGFLKIENDELKDWVDTDNQLIDVILKKLGLEKSQISESAK